ncbi:MAG: flagellar filament capping protein FliD, partial [Desulfovibrio sp.]|nr:flagellar filament capping protein FliD [Desulfovibrio sp.]
MSISISGSNAIFGLSGNDTDFEKVLSQLKKIESTQLNRLEAWKSDWNLRYESFTQIIEQIQAASSMLSQLSDKNNFVTKQVTSSNSNIITAVANASAQDVQHTINVSQVASNAIWANTGHIFDSKTDVINTTGQDQYFSYTYAGERHDFKVPANTTLESFASMINNSADNPGIKVSLIQTGKGYVFQVAGKDTGVENDLIIHDSNLVGMKATNSTSVWTSNSAMNMGESLTDPTSYTFDIVLRDGTKKSVVVKGNATADELVTALNNSASGINARLENGDLVMDVQSFTRRKTGEDAYTPPSLRVSFDDFKDKGTEKLNAVGGMADGMGDDDLIQFEITMDDGNTRTFEIKAGATKQDLLVALARNSQSGDDVNITMEANDVWGVNLSGVTGLEIKTAGVDAAKINTKLTDAKGDKGAMGGSVTAATTTLKFGKDELDKQINGATDKKDGDDLTFMLVREDGSVDYIDGIKSDMTNEELVDYLEQELTNKGYTVRTVADDGSISLSIDGVKQFRATAGTISGKGFETDLKIETTVPAANPDPTADSLFHVENGQYLLEKAPDLVYTVTTNDGKTGTLTMPSGTSMGQVMAAMQSASSWTWTDGEGKPVSAPADWELTFTDAEGNEITDPENFDGALSMDAKNIQTLSGPGVSGQISQSSNWNIQRSANAIYQIDNWPIEMESSSNTISDTIEGMVINIQDVGEARLSVSTDITSVEQSIQNFLDAVNSVLLTVNELMKLDETKQVTSNDPNDIGSDNYSPSGLTNQKGGLLMGNYGVQLFKSRFSSLLGASPPGFKSRTSADDILSGDVLATLSNMGIKTDTDSTSDTYGLLVLAPSSSIAEIQSMDKENYNNMITNNLEAVVDFFCSSGSGSSTSTDFRYGSHVEGITVAGTYDVKYTVTPDGEVTNVTIGGVPAKRDESQPGYYFSVAQGDPRGLSIIIDDLTVGDHPPAGADPMQVRIKQGLVQTTNNFLKAELVFNDVNISEHSTPQQIADAIALKSKNGALMSRRENYMK